MASSEVFMNEITDTPQGPTTFIKGTRRMGRPRAKVACRDCRRRKVRCDVYQRGAPCTNCHLDQIECTILKRKRHRKPHEQRVTLKSPAAERYPSGSSTDSLENAFRESQSASQTCSRKARVFENQQSPISVLDDGVLDTYLGGFQARTSSERSQDGGHTFTSTRGGLLANDLPCYILCDLSHISRENISYLQGKGCFTLPEKEILDDLLKCYFDYIHPHVPFLDEQEFWETYLDRDSENQCFQHTDGYRISLLLFQAVLFAATTCAPLSVLRKAGYNSRAAARRNTFYKVHALYSLEVEQERMVVLQALLLMSFWRGTSDEDRDAWHWSGLAISLASSLGLYCQSDTQLSERRRTLQKRCWWSCVLRDRLLALSEQRAPRIRLDEYAVPLLTLADYNVGLRCAISELSPEEELGKRTALSMFSLQLIRLVLLIGKEGSCPCGDLDSAPSPSKEIWARTRVVTHDDGFMTGLGNLDFWRLNLPEVLQRPTEPIGDDAVLSCILVHRNALHIYYQKLIISICMQQLLDYASRGDFEHSLRLAHRSRATLADLYDELIDRDSIHCLPGECFGPSSSLGQLEPQTVPVLEQAKDDEAHAARIYTSLMVGSTTVSPQSMEPAISSPHSPDLSARHEPQHSLNMASVDTMDIDRGHESSGIALGKAGHESELDPVVNFISDSFWTIGDVESYGDISSTFPDLAADEPTNTPGTGVLMPSTLPTLDAFLYPESGEAENTERAIVRFRSKYSEDHGNAHN